MNDEPTRLYFGISYSILEHISIACRGEVHVLVHIELELQNQNPQAPF